MSEILLWIVKATVVALIGAIGAVFMRLRTLESKRTAADVRLAALESTALGQRVGELEEELRALHLVMAENYVRRDDYITNESRVIGLLESHSVMLARLEERIGVRS